MITIFESSSKRRFTVRLICGGASEPIRTSFKCFNPFKYFDNIAKPLLKSKYFKFMLSPP